MVFLMKPRKGFIGLSLFERLRSKLTNIEARWLRIIPMLLIQPLVRKKVLQMVEFRLVQLRGLSMARVYASRAEDASHMAHNKSTLTRLTCVQHFIQSYTLQIQYESVAPEHPIDSSQWYYFRRCLCRIVDLIVYPLNVLPIIITIVNIKIDAS